MKSVAIFCFISAIVGFIAALSSSAILPAFLFLILWGGIAFLAFRLNLTPRIPHSIHFRQSEKYADLIQGSLVLFRSGQILIGGAVLFFVLIFAVALSRPDLHWVGIIAPVMVFVLVSWMLTRSINYKYNVCILTDQRVINIKRSRLLIREVRMETEGDAIREVEARVANFYGRLFDIGTVHIIVTLPELPDIRLSRVDHPFDMQEKIHQLY